MSEEIVSGGVSQKPMSREEIRSQCIFCQIADKKIPSLVIYEDDDFICFLDINPANAGHVLVIPKEHYAIISQMPDNLIKKLGILSKKISYALLKSLAADGTNIFIANGAVAGQRAPHFILHVIPRFDNDGVNSLNPKKNVLGQDKVLAFVMKLRPELEKMLGKSKTSEVKKLKNSTKDNNNNNTDNTNNIDNTYNINNNNQSGNDEETSTTEDSSCIICKLSKNHIVYETEKFVAFVPEHQMGKFTLGLSTKKHYTIIEKVPDEDFGDLFILSNKLMIALFQIFNAQGTNILIQNGTAAGQELNHFMINLIPRFENDGLNFQWEPKKVSREELKSTFDLILEQSSQIILPIKETKNILEETEGEVIDLDGSNDKNKDENNESNNSDEENVNINLETSKNPNNKNNESKNKKEEKKDNSNNQKEQTNEDKENKDSIHSISKKEKEIIPLGKNNIIEQLRRIP